LFGKKICRDPGGKIGENIGGGLPKPQVKTIPQDVNTHNRAWGKYGPPTKRGYIAKPPKKAAGTSNDRHE